MKLLLTLLIAGLLTGCSSVSRFTSVTNLVDYSNHKSVKVLEIPSDLDAPVFNKTYITTVSDSVATAVATKPSRLDQVPLVDKSIRVSQPSLANVVQKGAQVVLQIEDDPAAVWTRTNNALKSMGMTISQSDQASGVILARDSALVASPDSPIGRLLNKSLGRANKGVEYQFRTNGAEKITSIEAADKSGRPLSVADARLVLERLRKEYTK